MLDFIQLLKQRYKAIIDLGGDSLNIVYQERINSLRFAESFVRKGRLIESAPKHPIQIAVIGPTQAGKSSISNLLLGTSAAGVSPLAGYTVHPQGFCHNLEGTDYSWLNHYFVRFQCLKQNELSKAQYACYSLTNLDSHRSDSLPDCILWDTPDFDSIDANTYREGVLRTVALADVIILVVSKEKYADQSVWDMMTLLEGLHQPTLIIVNKLVEDSQYIVLQSLQEKWQQSRKDAFPEVIPIIFQKGGNLSTWSKNEQQRTRRLIDLAVKKSKRSQHTGHEQQFLKSHWQKWIEPILAEQAAQKDWQKLLDDCIKSALKDYQRDYLNHPLHYETFQNALAELLTLLEIPGLAMVLGKTRKIITWPARKLFRLGYARKNKAKNLADTSHEVTLLKQISEHTLISIADQVLERIEQSPGTSQWWKEINSLLRQQKSGVLQSFQQGVIKYHNNFQIEVDSAAQGLYQQLQNQPFVLNSLRATRVTTDAAAIALALHTGGIGLHDLIITPAMLSVTSLLTESAMGSYMTRVEAELKQKQLYTVKQDLFIDILKKSLLNLPGKMNHQTRFNVSEQQLLKVQQQLTEKRHGLRIF